MMKNFGRSCWLLLALLSFGNLAFAKEKCLPAKAVMLDQENFVFYIDKDKKFTGCIETVGEKNITDQSIIENGKLKKRAIYDQNDVLRADVSYSNNYETEHWRNYYLNGKVGLEEQVEHGKREGVAKLYWENGQLKGENTYKNDQLDGKFTKYFEDGKLHVIGNYKEDKLDGEVIVYYPDGRIKSKNTFKDDKIVYQTRQLKIGGEMKEAVVINSVPAEYEYLRQEYPDYKFVMQAAIINDEVEVDVLTIENAVGERKDIYFDISSFYGNYAKMFQEGIDIQTKK